MIADDCEPSSRLLQEDGTKGHCDIIRSAQRGEKHVPDKQIASCDAVAAYVVAESPGTSLPHASVPERQESPTYLPSIR